jgi:MFS family permease
MAFLVAPFAGKLTVRIHSRYLLGTGLALVTLGLALMSTTTPTSGWTQLLPGFLVAGAGIGMVNPVLASAAISVVPPERSGMASGINSTFRQVGIATGIAGLGAIFQSQIQAKTFASLATTAPGREALAQFKGELGPALSAGQVQAAAAAIPNEAGRATLLHAYSIGFSSSLNLLLVIGAVIAAVGAVGSFALVRQRDFVPSYTPQGPPGAATGGPAPGLSDSGVPDSGVPDSGVPDSGVPDSGVPASDVPAAASADAPAHP